METNFRQEVVEWDGGAIDFKRSDMQVAWLQELGKRIAETAEGGKMAWDTQKGPSAELQN